jgi:hypothetical protein
MPAPLVTLEDFRACAAEILEEMAPASDGYRFAGAVLCYLSGKQVIIA